MLEGWGVEFIGTIQQSYMSQPWAHQPAGHVGASILAPLEQHIADSPNAELLCGNRARKLIQDATGRVIGVEAETDEGSKFYKAEKGVIIATGGFSRNPVLAKAFGRKGSQYIRPVTGMGSLGDGLLMGLAAGADVSYLGAGVGPTGAVGCVNLQLCCSWMTSGAIMVGTNGTRFHDESDNYVLITKDAMDLPDGRFFQVYDAEQRRLLEEWEGLSYFGLTDEPEMVGETVAELGAAIKEQYPDFDVDGLVKTVETYNEYCAEGHDADFGREHLIGQVGDMTPVATGPFYAVACYPTTTHFNGGLKIDSGMRVLNAIDEGVAIPGLYAAGEVTGGFHGYGYMSGTAFGKAIIFGAGAAYSLIADTAE